MTDRLHSAILGTILGIPVTLMPNSYHKNRAVWEYSLSERGVKWLDELKMSRVASAINSLSLMKEITQSHLFERFFKLYYGIGYKALHSRQINTTVLG